MSHKIAIFQRDVLPASPFSKNLYKTVEEMVRRGWTVDVLLLDPSSWRADSNGSLFTLERNLKFLPAHYAAIVSIGSYLSREKPGYLIAKGPVLGISAVFAKLIVFSKVKLFISLHIPLSVHQKTKMYRSRKFIPFIMKVFSPVVDKYVCVSHAVCSEYVEMTGIPSNKFFVLNHACLEEAQFLEDEPTKFNFVSNNNSSENKQINLLAVGRLAPEKGFHVLVEAISQLASLHNFNCRLVGDGPCREGLEILVKEKGLSDVIKFTGRIDDVTSMYDWADIFVLPSFYEGLPNVILEALSRGCPVVATDSVGGTADLLVGGKHGTLVAPGDPSDLARGILQELSQERNAEDLLGRAKFFSVKKTVDRWCELFG